jgi:[protein-PII] uridylyltransferase
MTIKTTTRAERLLRFAANSTHANRLAAIKTFVAEEHAEQLQHHRSGDSGLRVAAMRAATIDSVLESLFEFAMNSWRSTRGAPPSAVSLIALGGYGRSELCPLSDVDVMFLYPAKADHAKLKDFEEHLTREILYLLWDASLKVGHSSRTTSEAFDEARSDMQTKTALLEARLVTGTTALFETFQTAYRNFSMKEDPKGYISLRLADQEARRAKFGGSVFMQEPNIKNGVGGLRDFQNALWMARVKLGVTRMEELEILRILFPDERRDFEKAYDFLLRVRNELHFSTRHATDLLNLESQPRVARELGYTQADMIERVEAFMQDYYRHARLIFRVSKLIEERLALSLTNEGTGSISLREVIRARRADRLKRVDGFIIRGNDISAEDEGIFAHDPNRLIRLFRHCQQLGCKMEFALTRLVADSRDLIDDSVRNSPDANLSFRAILNEAGHVHTALASMHELGVLGRFVPEFEALNCLVQHEFFHRYTADVHTLSAIGELDRIFSADRAETEKYRAELHEINGYTLLYLILLLHDIGKGVSVQGHADIGVQLAAPILERLQVPEKDRETVNFVIRHHLAMVRFWQKHDIEDPRSIAQFAALTGDIDKLRYLYVHTYCDARGTSTDLWNGYKDQLHTALFRRTADFLRSGTSVEDRVAARKSTLEAEVLRNVPPQVTPGDVAVHFSVLPDRYFIQTEADEIRTHLKMINSLLANIVGADSSESLQPVIEWHDDVNQGFTVVHLATWDRLGLFFRLAGAFSVAGLNILNARAFSRSDHIVIDTFHVVEPGYGIVQSPEVKETFARTVHAALVDNANLLPDIQKQAGRIRLSRVATEERKLHSQLPPRVEIYRDEEMDRIIFELECRDRLGLLYRIARALFENEFDINFARINTERGTALGTFFLSNADSAHSPEADRIHSLNTAIHSLISEPEDG